MCKENEPEARNGNSSTCCYNSYYNGSECVRCPAGFYGNNCIHHCKKGFYGLDCIKECACNQTLNCHHIIGCSTDYPGNESSSIPNRDSENSSILHVTLDSVTNPVGGSNKENTYILPDTKVTGITRTITKSSSVGTMTIKPDAPITTTTGNSLDTNLFLMAIGGVIALFLGVIMVQLCIKLRTKRRKYSHQMSSKRHLATEEETYQEINESLIAVQHLNDNHNEHRQVGKYYELHTSGQPTSVPYDRIKNQLQYLEIIDDSLVASTNSSDSNNSATSYLKPKTNKKQSNLDNMDSSEIIAISEQNNQNDLQQVSNYTELQPKNSLTTELYKQIHTNVQHKDIDETIHDLSTSSGSNKSNTSYLKPKPNARHSYMEVASSDLTEGGKSVEERRVSLTDDSSNRVSSQYLDPIHDLSTSSGSNKSNTSYLKPKPNARHSYMEVASSDLTEGGKSVEERRVSLTDDSSNRVSSQYLDPIHDPHLEENVSKSQDSIDTSDAYLDVINETFL